MKKFLVSGGCGFIGSNLVEKLLKDGHQVYIIDNLTTGDYHNIPEGAKFLSVSIAGIKGEKFDGIFHLGAPSSSPILRKDPYLMVGALSDFITLLEYVKDNPATKLVYTSSSSVYNGCPTPSSEDMVLKPTDFYTEVRIAWERLANIYSSLYDLNTIGLRPFSVYGYREEYKKQYANLITQMIWAKNRGDTFDIYGTGEQRRDATFVTDVVEAYLLAMDSDLPTSVYNVGTGVNYNMNQVAKMIGVKVRYVPVPFKNYVDVTLADTTKAKTALGFKAKVSLEKGIRLLKGNK